MKRFSLFICLVLSIYASLAQTFITIPDADTWRAYQMDEYEGSDVVFTSPMYVVNNYYSDRLIIAPRRIFSPTNQCLPASSEMNNLILSNSNCQITLTGVSGYHRMGERIDGLRVHVDRYNQWSYQNASSWFGTREHTLVPPSVDGDSSYRLKVCAWNLEYYLVDNLGTGFGPDNQAQHNRQKQKVQDALNRIGADLYGFVEIEQGQSALKELAGMLGSNFTYINDGGTAYSSYVKVGYVYDSTKLEPVGQLHNNNTGAIMNRKKMIMFREKSTNETFIFSINHFKAKGSGGTDLDADQHDGQNAFNHTRVLEAQSVIEMYNTIADQSGESDILIMGDLNAYAKEDPIRTFTNNGFIDLHRAFHADSSYSYVYHEQAGYLDHAIVSQSLYHQITGMDAWHINSNEHDNFTYDKSTDSTMFRSSDHDPVLVGLRLNSSLASIPTTFVNNANILLDGTTPTICNAAGGYYRLYNINGMLINSGNISSDMFSIECPYRGFYILDIFIGGGRQQYKLIIR